MRVPHDWAIEGPFNRKEPGWQGKLPWKGEGRYRRTFDLSASAAPKSADGSSLAKEGDGVNLTCASDGGLWWDPSRRKFRLWYQADWLGDICYAESAP